MLGCIGGGCKRGQRLYGSIGEPRQDVAKILADRQAKTAAAFHDRGEGSDPWASLFAPQVQPVAAIGRMEFSARLLDSSSSGYLRNSVSRVHSDSV